MGDIRINVDGMPPAALRQGPDIGDVYKKDGGPAGFMLIVSDNGSNYGYLAFSPEGRVTGVGQGTSYYFSRRFFVGRAPNFPMIEVEWERDFR